MSPMENDFHHIPCIKFHVKMNHPIHEPFTELNSVRLLSFLSILTSLMRALGMSDGMDVDFLAYRFSEYGMEDNVGQANPDTATSQLQDTCFYPLRDLLSGFLI